MMKNRDEGRWSRKEARHTGVSNQIQDGGWKSEGVERRNEDG